MRFRFLVLSLSLSFAAGAGAQTDGRFELKNRSGFAGSADGRNPFWPIGWKKSAPTESATTVRTTAPENLKPDSFVVSSILLGSVDMPSLVVINGRGYAEGETVASPTGYTGIIQVAEIHDGTVVLQANGHRIIVPLRQK